MPSCKNNPSRSYKGTEPSPKGLGYCASGEKIGKKQKGKDGNMWIVKKISNSSKRWVKFSTNTSKKKDDNKKIDKKIKEKHKGFRKYKTHWNGGRPYLCYVKKNTTYYDIYIYKVGDEKNIKTDEVISGDEDWLYTIFVKHYKAKKVFIGKDSGKYKMSDIGKDTSFSIGNSILLQITKKKYVVIQENVCEFSTKDEITHYFSLIGRNDIPYPVGVGKKNIYFMADLVYIPRKYFPTNMKIANYEEAYKLYFNYNYLENNIKIQKNHTKHNFIGKNIIDSAY